jgi:hypothetical protein
MTANDVPIAASEAPADARDALANGVSTLAVTENSGDATSPSQPENKREDQTEKKPDAVPPHRSHDPQYNQKRSDPFQFGSRYLGEDDDVFEFNAWDHVETDDAYKEYAEQQYAMQRQSPVSEFDKSEFIISYFLLSFLVRAARKPYSRAHDDLHHKHSSSELSMKTTLYFLVFRSHLTRILITRRVLLR